MISDASRIVMPLAMGVSPRVSQDARIDAAPGRIRLVTQAELFDWIHVVVLVGGYASIRTVGPVLPNLGIPRCDYLLCPFLVDELPITGRDKRETLRRWRRLRLHLTQHTSY